MNLDVCTPYEAQSRHSETDNTFSSIQCPVICCTVHYQLELCSISDYDSKVPGWHWMTNCPSLVTSLQQLHQEGLFLIQQAGQNLLQANWHLHDCNSLLAGLTRNAIWPLQQCNSPFGIQSTQVLQHYTPPHPALTTGNCPNPIQNTSFDQYCE